MSVIPVVVHRHGASELTVSLVVSGHLAGMFALSRVIGSSIDRWGRRRGLLAGAVASLSGVLLGAFAGGTVLPAAGLLLIGVGWSAAYLGSTAVISDLSTPAERGRALGLTDLVAALAAATGVLGGAALLDVTSMSVLGLAAIGSLLLPCALLAPLREAAPGDRSVAMVATSRPSGS